MDGQRVGGVDDLGFVAMEPAETLGEVEDADGVAHVQDVDHRLGGVGGDGAGLNDQARGFVDGHEEARHARVGDGDGAAFGQLLAPDR